MRGVKKDGSAWRIAVQDANNTQEYVGVLTLSDSFAVTSGGYQRFFEESGATYHHIIDPSTGYPTDSGLSSVTIVAQEGNSGDRYGWDGTLCDALSTALFVMGEERAIEFWQESGYAFDFVLVTDDGRVLISNGVSDSFEDMEGTEHTYEIIG